jgi:RNA polymerase sigma-70 factor, ECF subfamily
LFCHSVARTYAPLELTEGNIDLPGGLTGRSNQVSQVSHGVQGDGAAALNEMEQEMSALYTLHAPGLLRYAFSLTNDTGNAQDALQEIFLRYFVARSEGQRFLDPKAWLFRVLRNHLLDTLKSFSVKNEVAIDKIEEPHDGSNDPESSYRGAEIARNLAKALAPRELECVRLRAEGLSYEEIAQVLDLRQGTVGATLARAHKKARRALGFADDVKEEKVGACAAPREENSYSS